jgi:hypothetical protein
MPQFDRSSGEPVGMPFSHLPDPHRPSDRELRLTHLYARQAADVILWRLDTHSRKALVIRKRMRSPA